MEKTVYLTYRKKKKIQQQVKDFFELEKWINETINQEETLTQFKTIRTVVKKDVRVNNYIKKINSEHIISRLRNYNENKESKFYKFKIPKKSGGFRQITAPNDDLKDNYNYIKSYIEYTMRVLPHNNAYAYIKGRSTKDAVEVHQKNNSKWFLKIDIESFFDSCNKELIVGKLSEIYPFSEIPQVIEPLADFAVFDGGLPQGTPLSPLLTNIIMVPFDYYFNKYCEENKLTYTRYADDLIISSKETFQFSKIIDKINAIFKNLEYPFNIKKEKTRYGSIQGRNWNLGLMLNKDNQITLGHKYKKTMKVLMHKLVEGEIPKNDYHIEGLFAYLKQIEPTYYAELNNYSYRKYGHGLKSILKDQ